MTEEQRNTSGPESLTEKGMWGGDLKGTSWFPRAKGYQLLAGINPSGKQAQFTPESFLYASV